MGLSIEWPRGGMVTQRIANPFSQFDSGRGLHMQNLKELNFLFS